MATHKHSRSSNSSSSSGTSNGSAYQLILEHILCYPGSYEIPLRTMYTLNCQPRGQAQSRSPTSSNSSSPTAAQATFPDSVLTETFHQNLMAQLKNLPEKQQTLPPTFLTAFVQRCFPSVLTHVDFPSSLTGLDYLKDLETCRRREIAAVFERLEIDKDALSRDESDFSDRYPGFVQWVSSIEEKERKIDQLSTQVWIGLRKWILINELSLQPFNKHNCVAMLNTLYPPMGLPNQPTTMLTPSVIKSQRDGFFKYILSVEKNGPSILRVLMDQGKAQEEDHGWAAVTRNLSRYLQVANSLIAECHAIANVDDVAPQKTRQPNQSRHTRKADSGISIASSDRRPSTRGSNGEPASPVAETARPRTPSGGRSGTTLEKLARGLRGIGRGRTDATEMIDDSNKSSFFQPTEKPKMLRKMRSLGSLSDRKGSISGSSSRQGSDAPAFDPEAMRQQRLKYEAAAAAHQGSGKRSSGGV